MFMRLCSVPHAACRRRSGALLLTDAAACRAMSTAHCGVYDAWSPKGNKQIRPARHPTQALAAFRQHESR